MVQYSKVTEIELLRKSTMKPQRLSCGKRGSTMDLHLTKTRCFKLLPPKLDTTLAAAVTPSPPNQARLAAAHACCGL